MVRQVKGRTFDDDDDDNDDDDDDDIDDDDGKCDNPVVGKHLDGNTRLLAEIYCSLRHVFRYIFIDNKCSSDTSNLYFVVPLVLVSVRLRRTVRDS
jgi:hypothetical protein